MKPTVKQNVTPVYHLNSYYKNLPDGSKQKVSYYRKYYPKTNHETKIFTDEEIKDIKQMHAAGLSKIKIAKRHNTTPWYIKKALDKQ